LRQFCRQTATVERKDRVINTLIDEAKPSLDDVAAAAQRIAGEVQRTPLIESEVDGVRVWLKCECLQTGGAFKLRGASNRLLQLSPEERERGVVAFSSGNHARGVAIAARRLGIRAIIVMPADAPKVKVDGTRAEGAEIVFYDRQTESREDIAARIAGETGATVVPSFDDPAIVTGQGTAGLEIVAQLGRSPARIVIPCGGGGLASGIALAVPDAEIVVVEPDGWDDMGRSLELGEIVPVAADAPNTFCDAIMTPRVSPLTFGILRDRRARALSVSDAEVADAIRFAWEKHGLVVEPGAAVALAALLSGKLAPLEDTVVVVSGGNIDPALHAQIIAEAA
jgi:threonine dehydratase